MLTFLDRAKITEEDYKDFVDDESEPDDDVDAVNAFRDWMTQHPVADTELETDF